MLNHLFIKNIPMVGIDIGSHTIKAVLLGKTHNQYKLEAFAIEPVAHGAVVAHDIRDRDAVAGALGRIRKKIPAAVKCAAMAVSGYTTINKTILMEACLTDSELEMQLITESDALFPYPLQQSYFDFQRKALCPQQPSKVQVELNIVRTSHIQPRLAAMTHAGFTAKVVDVEREALCRAVQLCFSQLPAGAEDKTIGLLDIGGSMLSFCVIRAGQVLYSREQLFAGIETPVTPVQTGPAITSFLVVQLLQQIRRNIELYQHSSEYLALDYLLLCGGTVLSADIAQLLSDELTVPVFIANPFLSMQKAASINPLQLAAQSAQLMIATGLALRSFSSCHL
ncbi:type IV pilus assembly protein PilM [Chromatiaceae bacterium AAb-1]|nr:type IV pilus assembly protein PilM [Chromatiaceae bacterium AAb-1]